MCCLINGIIKNLSNKDQIIVTFNLHACPAPDIILLPLKSDHF